MLEALTPYQIIAFVFSAAGIAVILQRVPKWDSVPPEFKKLVVIVLGQLAPLGLEYFNALVPPAYGDKTLLNIALGLAAAAVAFLFHLADEWFVAVVALKKTQAQKFSE